MQRFTQLYSALDRTTKTLEKTALLRAYLEAAPAEDAAWALFFLTGRKLPRAVNTRLMREAVSAATGLPPWSRNVMTWSVTWLRPWHCWWRMYRHMHPGPLRPCMCWWRNTCVL